MTVNYFQNEMKELFSGYITLQNFAAFNKKI